PRNIFSFTAPTVQFGQYGAVLTLETLGQRWGWEKTKVWRFLKNQDAFALHKFPGSYGCLIFNTQYPTGDPFTLPEQRDIIRILSQIRFLDQIRILNVKRISGQNTHLGGTDNERINWMIAVYSQTLTERLPEDPSESPENGVAVLAPITRAYFSSSNCESCRKRDYDCKSIDYGVLRRITGFQIRGPCRGP
ncbi:MAG: hypothetical protein FWC62_01805, partial [Firmicutes bacterium]|nr:hypothetical protein [Bacillota bacterium]